VKPSVILLNSMIYGMVQTASRAIVRFENDTRSYHNLTSVVVDSAMLSVMDISGAAYATSAAGSPTLLDFNNWVYSLSTSMYYASLVHRR
jgi:ABC-type branched-subunit amino acid transport system ATPase component